MKFYITIACFLIFFSDGNAQNKSNRGREFWLGYSFSSNFFPHAGLSDPVNQQELSLYISTQQAATVTVSINGTTWTQTVSIPANTADASIIIPKIGANDARILSDGLSSKGIKIVSDVPVAVYAHQYDAMYSAATMLMPTDTWGYTYYSVNYYQTRGLSNPPYTSNSQSVNFPDWYNWFYVVAKDDNTRVLITPSDTCKNGWLPGQTYTVNLSKGQIYTVFGKANFAAGWFSDTVNASKDLTGSKILSIAGADGLCHPVALFSGTGGMHTCQRDGGEAVQQQVFPAQAWGTNYLTHHTISNFTGDINATFRNYYRVCVKDPSTVVRRNGVILTGLKRNFFYDFVDSIGGDHIIADKPILVSQYTPNRAQCWMNITPAQTAIGDPEMFYLSPVEQGQKSVIFYTSSLNLISKSYLNIIIPTGGIASLRVDGAIVPASKIKVHPNNPAYSVAIADLSSTMDMQHTINSDSAFTATVYGLGAYESYGYNIGCNINNLNMRGEIKNVLSSFNTKDTVTCPKTPIRVFANVAYKLSNIHWKLSQVTGLSPNVDSIIANPIPIDSFFLNGRKYYTYSLQQDFTFANTGIYQIPVSYTHPDLDACNNTETENITVIVRPGPLANFTFTSPVCLKDSVYFTAANNANGFNLTQYLWTFADATTANTVNTVKKFNTSGTQNVRYRIAADNGCAGDTIKAVTIFDTPIANFGVTPNSICVGDSIRITDTSAIVIGTINNYYYDFGDNTNINRSTNSPFHHQYNTPGNYTIKLIVSSNNSCKSDTAYRTVTVRPKPIANFGFDRNICVNDSIRFTDTSSFTAGIITAYHWNFGNGNTAIRNTNTPFYHPYNNTGSFNVTMVAIGNNGCTSDTAKRTVMVGNKPSATVSAQFIPCVDSLVIAKSSVIIPGAIYHWNFGNGVNRSTSTDTAHYRYPMAGTYVIKHTVAASLGCNSDTSSTLPITINNIPLAQFSTDKSSYCEGEQIAINSLLPPASISIWRWTLPNGRQSNALPPFTTPTLGLGTNVIQLVTTSNGCNSGQFTVSVTVNEKPRINAGPDQNVLSNSTTQINATNSSMGNFNYLWTPSTGLNNPTILNPIVTPTATTTYTLSATNVSSNCVATDTLAIGVFSKLLVPNVFTPNNDGNNDIWKIDALAAYPKAVVTVYNRWGQKILDRANYHLNPWDGKFNGNNVPGGTYVYVIQLNNTQKEILKGTLLIIR